ncbi:membrane-bound lytic murein transglycosylase MltF [Methylobacillus flagellatus]|uniref:membrane-bound lytic murein transglycosylase MltF n=1 Tax=Methylobacillus flagellatus TaxID=405 RepID=UPI0010F5646F|nr:membrane-bound lytic murein transglycosylase MltF [Methylobacillus flagellatus]
MRTGIYVLMALLGLTGCDLNGENTTSMADVRDSKVIRVVTHSGPNTYYLNGDNEYAGMEHDLVQQFAAFLGPEYRVEFVLVNKIYEVLPTLMKGQADLAAADITITHLREHLVKFTVPYNTVQQQVVYNTAQAKPKDLDTLSEDTLAVPAGTSFAERLGQLSHKHPKLRWNEPKNVSSDELLEQVADGSLAYTVADSHMVAMVQNFYPNLGVAMPLGKPEQVAWAFPKNSDEWLYRQANLFFAKIYKDGSLRRLLERYYGHSERLHSVDVSTYLQRIRTLLPKHRAAFKRAEAVTGIDWRLLAAISYQESHWDRLNTSPTGVRGMMMLTEDTADRMGVTDRLDAEQSIMGGARYVQLLKDLLPERIQEPDRTWLALAAYNIGYAHLEDARVLAQRMQLNPDSWGDVKKTLPLLNKAEYYTTLKYGFARGGAPVIFVDSIRTYHKILEKHEARQPAPLPGLLVGMH